jgi:LPS-assembly lipoprotein
MILKTISMFVIMSLLSSCGFKLQGIEQIPSYMKELVILSNDNDPFIIQLNNCLKSKGIILYQKTDRLLYNHLPTLEITELEINDQIQGYNSRGQISNSKVYAKINYTLFDKEHKILKKNTINRSMSYQIDPNQLLSNNNERNIIVDELIIEIINELINQLSS